MYPCTRHDGLWSSWGRTPHIRSLDTRWTQTVTLIPALFAPGEKRPGTLYNNRGKRLVWNLWREKSLAPAWNGKIMEPPSRQYPSHYTYCSTAASQKYNTSHYIFAISDTYSFTMRLLKPKEEYIYSSRQIKFQSLYWRGGKEKYPTPVVITPWPVQSCNASRTTQ
jgi:hypothetical protein